MDRVNEILHQIATPSIMTTPTTRSPLDDARRRPSTSTASTVGAPDLARVVTEARRGTGREISSIWRRAFGAHARALDDPTSAESRAFASSSRGDVHARVERGVWACADAGDADGADALARATTTRFGETSRRAAFARCAAALARGDVTRAREILDGVMAVKDGDADGRASRMKIAAARHVGDDVEATRALTAYVERYGGDERAWLELGRAHAMRCAYEEALFCYEEVMCAMPFDPSAHRRAAETLYAMGGERNLRDAKNHFAAALDFTNGRDVRAMYGVVLCARKLREYAGEGGRAEGAALAAAAAERLLQRYVEENESLLGVVRPQLTAATS